MEFEWDEAKRERTIRERGIDFRYAITVFADPKRIESFSRSVSGEDRYFVIGKAAGGELLFIVFTWRQYEKQGENICCIISARAAHAVERRGYEALS
ncbi:MAG: BrnT family toxin [Acidobacteriaceae bacterium]|nr:BrnT family toxin [Acidobacteriaceae bacterium]MBV9779084.1 BrnT family toxin [Acidobacteriaceae bacterium]